MKLGQGGHHEIYDPFPLAGFIMQIIMRYQLHDDAYHMMEVSPSHCRHVRAPSAIVEVWG